jgi:hypothetical protein
MRTNRYLDALERIREIIDGVLVEGSRNSTKSEALAKQSTKEPLKTTRELSFTANILAFMKKHGAGRSGDRKFTLLAAYLAKGNASTEVSFAEIERQWNKMKVVLGGKLNGAYANRAKANGWIDTPKHGVYKLSSDWRGALNG